MHYQLMQKYILIAALLNKMKKSYFKYKYYCDESNAIIQFIFTNLLLIELIQIYPYIFYT